MNKRSAGPITSLFVGVIFTLIGVGIIFYKALPDYKLAKESMSWPQTDGEIISSEVISSKNNKNETQYSAEVLYAYEVDGNEYESSQLSVGNIKFSSSQSSSAYKVKAKYPVGGLVTVYYSNVDFGNAVLEPGVGNVHYMFIAFGLVFALIGLVILLSGLFKLAVFATMVGVIISALFGKKDKKKKFRPTLTSKKSNSSKVSHKDSSDDDEIDLDKEMSALNKVSTSYFASEEEPWKHQWFIKGTKKDYGPYSFEKILAYFEEGKVKGNHNCYSVSDKEIIKISSIINKKKVKI